MEESKKYVVAVCHIGGSLSTLDSVNISLKLRNLSLSTKYIIFIISSTGGPLPASQALIRSVSRIKQERGIETYSYVISDALSNAFHFALSADMVYSERSSCLGNIGATFKYLDTGLLGAKLGLALRGVDSGPFKSELNKISDTENKPNIKKFVDNVNTIFADELLSYRENASSQYISLLKDGRIISADEAIANALIDRIGGLPDILEDICAKSGGGFSLEDISYAKPNNNSLLGVLGNVFN